MWCSVFIQKAIEYANCLVKGELSELQLWQEMVVVFNWKPCSLPLIFHLVNDKNINHEPQ